MVTGMDHRSKSPHFHGWSVLASAFFILFFVVGTRTIVSVMFKSVTSELCWQRSDLSSIVFLNMVVFATSLTCIGKYFDRYGARKVILYATICLAFGYLGLSFSYSFWSFAFFYGVLGAIGLGGTSVPLFAALIGKWFFRHRGLAISLALGGGCLGQFILVPLSTQAIQSWGWRTTCLIIGLFLFLVNLFLNQCFIKDSPSDLDEQPYGFVPPTPVELSDGPDKESSLGIPATDATLAIAARTASFWFFFVVMVVCGGADYLVLTHLIPMVTDHGISATTAGKMLGWVGLMSLAGVVLTGPAIDRFGNKKPIVITFCLRTLIFLIIWKYQTLWSYYAFALVFGFTLLITAPITTTLLGKLYGFRHIGLISGAITTAHHFSGGFWAYLGGAIYDATGNYQSVFIISALLASAAVVSAVLIRE